MYTIRPLAVVDLDTQAQFYRENASEEVARSFLDAARGTFQLLSQQPGAGWKATTRHPALLGLRVFRIRKFPRMLVLYVPAENQIDILRVVHGSRDLERLLHRDGF